MVVGCKISPEKYGALFVRAEFVIGCNGVHHVFIYHILCQCENFGNDVVNVPAVVSLIKIVVLR